MIKLHNLDKYFFRRKSNEIHVINNISLDLPERGLVVLLGPSGSGKTTLLNVIGGLDKTQGGLIDFDGEIIKGYRSGVWDKIRNRKIGYIFQNYNLLHHLTVYDNIKISLNMAGIVEKEEIDKRIDYVLDSIGMINYRKRRASQLSGGQQQRVAIARALCKNPKVIIADEPTGNLDSKNTIEIMNIIKSISKEKLVILVTHEQELADFYADRVINLVDGKIVSDSVQEGNGSLEYKHETDIYLKDLKQFDDIKGMHSSVKIYSDEELDSVFDMKLVIKNKTLYLYVDNDEYKKRTLLDGNSEVRLLDQHYETVTTETMQIRDFDFDQIINEEAKLKKTSVISTKESLSYAFKRFVNTRTIGKILYAGFAGLALLIAMAIGMLFRIYTFEGKEYLQGEHKDSAYIEYNTNLETADFFDLESEEFIDYLYLPSEKNYKFETPKLFQAGSTELSFRSRGAVFDYIDGKLLAGEAVQDYNEIVLDKYIADDLLKNYQYTQLGYQSYEDLLNLTINLQLEGPYGTVDYTIKVVGIYETESQVFYATEELLYMMYYGIGIYEVFEDQITISEGEKPGENTEALILDYPLDTRDITSKSHLIQGNDVIRFNASGLYTSTNENIPSVLIELSRFKEVLFDDAYDANGQQVQYHINDAEAAKTFFDDGFPRNQVSSIDLFKEVRYERLTRSIGTIIFASVVIGTSSIASYFILRSSLLSRIYEISVYRALGASKLDISKMFLVETLLITTLTSLPGFIAASFLEAAAGGYINFMEVSPLSIATGLVLIYVVNVVSGLLPVSNLLRRTPAEILSKFDF